MFCYSYAEVGLLKQYAAEMVEHIRDLHGNILLISYFVGRSGFRAIAAQAPEAHGRPGAQMYSL